MPSLRAQWRDACEVVEILALRFGASHWLTRDAVLERNRIARLLETENAAA